MRMTVLRGICAVLIAGLPLAACGSEPAGTTAEAAQGGDVAGAEGFVRDLYAQYDDTPLGTGPEAEPWSARTQALWNDNAQAAQGVGYLGFDPVCNCQDWTKLAITDLTVTPAGPDRADAAVVFVNGEPPVTVRQTLKLVREAGAWRINDIVWGEGATVYGEPNMVEGLIASTAELKAAPADL